MADSVTSASDYPSFVNVIQEWDTMKAEINVRIQQSSFTATADNTTHIIHNLGCASTDDLLVFYDGMLLEKDYNYTENADTISIDLNGWTISSGESIFFKIYRSVL